MRGRPLPLGISAGTTADGGHLVLAAIDIEDLRPGWPPGPPISSDMVGARHAGACRCHDLEFATLVSSG